MCLVIVVTLNASQTRISAVGVLSGDLFTMCYWLQIAKIQKFTDKSTFFIYIYIKGESLSSFNSLSEMNCSLKCKKHATWGILTCVHVRVHIAAMLTRSLTAQLTKMEKWIMYISLRQNLYREKAVHLKRYNCTWNITTFVNMKTLGQCSHTAIGKLHWWKECFRALKQPASPLE